MGGGPPSPPPHPSSLSLSCEGGTFVILTKHGRHTTIGLHPQFNNSNFLNSFLSLAILINSSKLLILGTAVQNVAMDVLAILQLFGYLRLLSTCEFLGISELVGDFWVLAVRGCTSPPAAVPRARGAEQISGCDFVSFAPSQALADQWRWPR